MKPDEKNVTPDHADSGEEATANYRGLKALVIGLGVGIVAMLGLIFYTIAERAAESMLAEDKEPQVSQAFEPVSSLSELEISRPDGSELVSVSSSGGELLLHFRSETGDMIIAVNRSTGEQTRVHIPD